jgi:hypothetical protein
MLAPALTEIFFAAEAFYDHKEFDQEWPMFYRRSKRRA